MGYDIHISHADNWFDEEEPVTLEQVKKIMPLLSGQFRIVEDGIITIENSWGKQGKPLTMDIGPHLEYTGEDGVQTCIVFQEDGCPFFRYQSDKQLLAMCSVAEALGAKLLGDDGEEYTREQFADEETIKKR